jgi:hypothetical protein
MDHRRRRYFCSLLSMATWRQLNHIDYIQRITDVEVALLL